METLECGRRGSGGVKEEDLVEFWTATDVLEDVSGGWRRGQQEQTQVLLLSLLALLLQKYKYRRNRRRHTFRTAVAHVSRAKTRVRNSRGGLRSRRCALYSYSASLLCFTTLLYNSTCVFGGARCIPPWCLQHHLPYLRGRQQCARVARQVRRAARLFKMSSYVRRAAARCANGYGHQSYGLLTSADVC
jgi:hypothetical protein